VTDTPFDTIVIGTGFGGAVAACRLAQAGKTVCILERGRRYPLGDFPRPARPRPVPSP
jgi:cholesterol oxidase